MHAVQISFCRDPGERRPRELLRFRPSMVDVAEAAAMANVRVSVVQTCVHSERVSANGVEYCFLPLELPRFASASALAQSSNRLRALLHELRPDVLHVHGLGFQREILALAEVVPEVPILLQHRADKLPAFWSRPLWRRGFAVVSGAAFCEREQAEPFIACGLVRDRETVHEIPGSSSRFLPGDRDEARRQTGLFGEPAVLWVGNLNDNKDPMTVLEGIAAAARRLPGLQLWCCYSVAPLLDKVERKIAADPRLAGRVHLLGNVPHDRIECLMQAADFFVSGSRQESTGYALLEALACGLPPLATGIPAFRALTSDGITGRLWRCGDAQDLSQALYELSQQPQAVLRAAARAHFDRELSFPALGGKLKAVYQHLVEIQHASARPSHMRAAWDARARAS